MPIVRLATCEAGGLSAWSPWPRAGTGGSSPLTTTSARSCRLLQTRGQRNRRRATLGDNVRPSAAAGSAQKRTFANYRFVTKFNAASDQRSLTSARARDRYNFAGCIRRSRKPSAPVDDSHVDPADQVSQQWRWQHVPSLGHPSHARLISAHRRGALSLTA